MNRQTNQYSPLTQAQTVEILDKANQLLDRVRRNLKSGEAIKITNEEYCQLQR